MLNKNAEGKKKKRFHAATKILLGAIKQQLNVERRKYGLVLRLRERVIEKEGNGLRACSSSSCCCETGSTLEAKYPKTKARAATFSARPASPQARTGRGYSLRTLHSTERTARSRGRRRYAPQTPALLRSEWTTLPDKSRLKGRSGFRGMFGGSFSFSFPSVRTRRLRLCSQITETLSCRSSGIKNYSSLNCLMD